MKLREVKKYEEKNDINLCFNLGWGIFLHIFEGNGTELY